MRAINEDDVKRLIRSEKRNWRLTQFPGVTEALNHVEGGLVGIRTVESHMPRWISVEERLPERYKHVLVATRFTDGGEPDLEIAYFSIGGWKKEEGRLYGKVTHWMPLPSTEGIK